MSLSVVMNKTSSSLASDFDERFSASQNAEHLTFCRREAAAFRIFLGSPPNIFRLLYNDYSF